eukprot:gene5831-9654_t
MSEENIHTFNNDDERHQNNIIDELTILKKEKMERELLDETILFAPVEFSNGLPISLKPIYLSLLKWKTLEENPIYLKNIETCIDYCLKKNIDDIYLSCYWIHTLYRLLNLLKLEKPEHVSNCFSSTPKDRTQELYNQVVKLIENDFEAICSFSDEMTSLEETKENFLESIVLIFMDKGKEEIMKLLEYSVKREVEMTVHATTLFRSNSTASKLMKYFFQKTSIPYLKKILYPFIDKINNNLKKFEIDPKKIKKNENLEENIKNLEKYCDDFLSYIFYSVEYMSEEMKVYCKFLNENVEKKFEKPTKSMNAPFNLSSSEISIGGFLFLRLINSSLLTSIQLGIYDKPLNQDAMRFLILITKIIQNLSNGIIKPSKEEYMNPMIAPTKNWIPKMKDFYQRILNCQSTNKRNNYNVSLGQLYHSRKKIYYSINEKIQIFKYEKEFLELKKLIEFAGASSKEILYPPKFYSFLNNNILTNESTSFGSILHLYLSRSYVQLIENLYERLEKPMTRYMLNFELVAQPIETIDKRGIKIQHEIVEILDEYLKIFKNNYIEQQIINHFFETIIFLIDEFITNTLLKHAKDFNMIELKMALSYIENWILLNEIKSYRDRDEKSQNQIFAYCRQCINIRIICPEEILNDFPGLSSILCPLLNKDQVSSLLNDFISSGKSESFVIKKFQSEISKILIKNQIDLFKYTDYKTGKLIEKPLFDLDLDTQRNYILEKIELSERFKNFDFLFSKFYIKVRSGNKN